jgi:predicted DNA-binding protein (MmcQ/YjbR family)
MPKTDKIAASFFTYLKSLPESFEDYPFGPETSIFKIRGKMFATFGEYLGKPAMNLKCDPEQALALRDVFESVIPGYHMNKKHWNTVFLDGSIPTPEVERMIDHSLSLVIKGLKKSDRLAVVAKFGEEIINN